MNHHPDLALWQVACDRSEKNLPIAATPISIDDLDDADTYDETNHIISLARRVISAVEAKDLLDFVWALQLIKIQLYDLELRLGIPSEEFFVAVLNKASDEELEDILIDAHERGSPFALETEEEAE